jgi:hypothetical protein
MVPKNFLFAFILIRISIPSVGLLVSSEVDIRKVPEYAEYLRQANLSISTTTLRPTFKIVKPCCNSSRRLQNLSTTMKKASISTTTITSKSIDEGAAQIVKLADSPLPGPFGQFPSIQLCKDAPAENNFYGHVFCWAMMGLYALLVITLIIYQLRSILWIKDNVVLGKKDALKMTSLQIKGAKQEELDPKFWQMIP